jgi:PAS domain S-box-containing protein
VSREQKNQSQNWQKADARVLGQILAAQNIIFTLAETYHIAEFYAQALITVPGIAGCRVCLGGKSVQAGEMESSVCTQCGVLYKLAEDNETLILANSNVKCGMADQPDMRLVVMASFQHHFGLFIFKIKNADVFDLYQPFIINLVNYVTLFLENRLQQNMLLKAHDELERKVEERTHDLAVANEALSASRLVALNMMEEAITARQRAEQTTIELQTEVAERKRAEEALYEGQQVFRALVENSQDIIARYGRDCRRTYVNPVYLQAAQIPQQELLGTSPLQCSPLPEPGAVALQNLLRRVLDSGVAEAIDLLWPMADNVDHWYNVYAYPEFDREGQVVSVMSISRDITARKQVEEKISKLNEELEQRVIDRTVQLEAANKELEAFSYSVSHDLRAPLRHITGFIEVLQDRSEIAFDEQSRHYMAVIDKSAKEMDHLISDLLSFSRMSRNELYRSQVDLNELIKDVIQEYKPETESRDIRWQISVLPLVTGDRAMLRLVLVNLISNALKFTRTRKITQIEIGCEKEDDAEVIILVRDNGVGFDMTYADKLFGVFQRLHRADEFEGTGIGLANVRRIINRHGGKTWAEGEVDKGATFYFTLPQLGEK